jgi:dUTP pyrophosphatase
MMKKYLLGLDKLDYFSRPLYKDLSTGLFYCDVNLLPQYDPKAYIHYKGRDIEGEPDYPIEDYVFVGIVKKNHFVLDTNNGSFTLVRGDVIEGEKERIIRLYVGEQKRSQERGFEKVSSCEDAKLPQRATTKSAGYDFFAYEDGIVYSGEKKLFRTGIKAYMNDNEVLLCYPRSSLGIKFGIRLTNGTGVIDSDYYNNPQNEGEIHVSLHNTGDKPFEVKKGDKIFQAMFVNYLTVDNDEPISKERIGGIGSTGK